MLQSATFPGKIIPKPRPRVTENSTYMPPAYTEWKRAAAFLFQDSFTPILRYPVSVHVVLTGKHRLSGDSDNTVGSVLDALQDAKILDQDNWKHVVDERGTLFYDKKKEPRFTVLIDDEPVLRLRELRGEIEPLSELYYEDLYYEIKDYCAGGLDYDEIKATLLSRKELTEALIAGDETVQQQISDILRDVGLRAASRKTLLCELTGKKPRSRQTKESSLY
jgi:Holliday junction resolvase RusA-like endonuclease